MKNTGIYREYHPRWYRTRISTYWWSRRWSYLKFILRELSSIFVAYFVVLTLLALRGLSQGPAEYQDFQQWLKTPHILAVNTISFCFALFHTVTWFNLAPRAMVIRVGGKRLPGGLIAVMNYLTWGFISALIVRALLGRG